MRHALPSLLLAVVAATPPAVAQLPDACRSGVDDPPPAGGPRDHRVVQATSGDGAHFVGVDVPDLVEASVPDAVERANGEVLVYYVSGSAGRHGILIGRLDETGTIQPFDCVRLDGTFSGRAVDPDVVELPDGRLRLFYKADFGLPPDGPSIYSAISTDGVHFTVEGPALDADGGYDPTVVPLADGTWLMAYPGQGRVNLARSADGQQFTAHGETVAIVGIPELWVDGNRVHLFAGGGRLYHATSDDAGATWSSASTISIDQLGDQDLGAPSMAGGPGGWRLFLVRGHDGAGPPPGGGGHCQPSDTVLCLGDGRFRATARWSGASGPRPVGDGHARSLGGDSGTFWFFQPGNVEVLVKVVDGCAVNNRRWVFAAGLTNLAVDLAIEDTTTGRRWTRQTPGGQLFPPIADTQALATCPP